MNTRSASTADAVCSRFLLFHSLSARVSDSRVLFLGLIYYARSRDDVPHLETHKYAATFHVFAAITRDGVLPLRYYDNSLNAENHCRILDHVFKDIETMRSGLPCVFQHDGAPYSNAKYAAFVRFSSVVLVLLVVRSARSLLCVHCACCAGVHKSSWPTTRSC